MLTLKKFELQISNTMVHRGREYFESGAVLDLDETGKNCWQTEVMGSENYMVEVTLFKKNNINSISCTCPYEDDICKHVVAVLFSLREQLTNTVSLKKVSPKSDFKTLLQKKSLAEYQEFILAHATKDKKFKSLFERHFADKDAGINIEGNYTKLLKGLINSYSRRGFINYESTRQLTKEINGLLDEGQQLIQKSNFRNAFILVRSVLTAIIELITYSDDSSGYIGDTIYTSIELIKVIAEAEKVATDLQDELFDFVGSCLNDPMYFDYGDFGYSLADMYYLLAVKLNKENLYLEFINNQLKLASDEGDSYKKDHFLVQKIEFLRATGNTSEAEKLVRQHLDVEDIRRGEVNTLVKKEDFHAAKKLIAEGIEIARKQKHPGTIKDWEKDLLHIAHLENDKEKIRYYTKAFAFDRGFDRTYYKQWKDTFSTSEWTEEIEKYISEKIAGVELQYQQNKGKFWYSPDTLLLDLLAPIYIEEQYWDRLLSLMSKETDLDRLLRYHDCLAKIFPLQLLAIYIPAFMRKIDTVSNRREYTDLAAKMSMVIKSIPDGKDEVIAIAEEINRKYPRRPAMVQELNKVISMHK